MTSSNQDPAPKKKSGRPAKYHYPTNLLRQKVGSGGIDPRRLEEAESFIDGNDLDFFPYGLKLMERLNVLLKDARESNRRDKKTIDSLTKPIMELKANGGMFKYRLISEIADVILDFLETVPELTDECFDIIDVHQTALSGILSNKLRGDGGKEGRILADELYKATRRYYKKHDITR